MCADRREVIGTNITLQHLDDSNDGADALPFFNEMDVLLEGFLGNMNHPRGIGLGAG